jgi:hypothetical protein
MGKAPNKGFNSDIDAKRKEHEARQKKAIMDMEKRKKQETKGQSAGAKVENGRRPGDQAHD